MVNIFIWYFDDTKYEYKIGDKIKFKSEKQRYTIRACDERFIIATKPLNCKRTFIYTIIDLHEKERAGDNYYCKYDYPNPEEAKKALQELQETVRMKEEHQKQDVIYCDGFWLSGRSYMELDIERIDHG